MAIVRIDDAISPQPSALSPQPSKSLGSLCLCGKFSPDHQTDNNRTASPNGNRFKSIPPGVTTHNTGKEGDSLGKKP
jgi:hypothetical protein